MKLDTLLTKHHPYVKMIEVLRFTSVIRPSVDLEVKRKISCSLKHQDSPGRSIGGVSFIIMTLFRFSEPF